MDRSQPRHYRYNQAAFSKVSACSDANSGDECTSHPTCANNWVLVDGVDRAQQLQQQQCTVDGEADGLLEHAKLRAVAATVRRLGQVRSGRAVNYSTRDLE